MFYSHQYITEIIDVLKQTDKTIDKLNKLKIILKVDENYIYQFFPTRKNNFYAKSVKELIPFKGYDYSNDAINILINNLQLPDTKYYGINIKEIDEGRLEFRYLGDVDYQFKSKEILDLTDYFISLTWNCINEELDDEETETLRNYLDENINNFKNFNRFENFISEFPTIQLEIDKNDDFIIVKSYYNQIYSKLYDVIKNIENLNNCIINYDTDSKKLEIVDADFKTIFEIRNLKIIDCVSNNGTYSWCTFINTEVKNCHLYNCILMGSEAFNCKMENCNVDQSTELKRCYYDGGTSEMNGNFISGTWRSGKVGEYGELGDDVKIISDTDSYFNTELEKDEDNAKSKSSISKKLNHFIHPQKF